MSWFDDNCSSYFIKEPTLETVQKIRQVDGIVGEAQIVSQTQNKPVEQALNAVQPPTRFLYKPASQTTGSFECMAEYIPLDQALISKEDPKSQAFGEMLQQSKPKLLAIYYSMHDCPPCREFTPILAALYEEVNEDEKVLEIVFFSGDKTQGEFDEYYGEMPWLALPRDQNKIMMQNAKKFKIKGVPRLIMLRTSDGKVLSEQCYEKLRDEGPMAVEEFLNAE